MSYIGNVKVGSTTHLVGSTLYGTCNTAAGTKEKAVVCANFDKLLTGVTIHVKFDNTNTIADPTLNVNSTGAKAIKRYGTTAPSTSVQTSWYAGAVISFTYDGTYWMMDDWTYTADGNTDTKVRQTLSTTNKNYPLLLSYSESSDTTANVDNVSYRANAIYANPSTGNIQTTKLNGVTVGSSPKFTDTTYTGSNGVSLSGTTFSNSGVRSIATGSTNGTISVNTNGTSADVAVKGLGSNAYTSTSYLPTGGGTLTGRTIFKNVSMPLSAGKVTSLGAGTTEVFKDGVAISNPATANDVGWIRVTGTGESDTVMEIATGDDAGAGEQIVVRQYNTSTNVINEAKLLDNSGNTSFPKRLGAKIFQELITGSGTAAQDKGSGVSPRYFPAKWTFNTGLTATDGDIVTIKIPVAGHDYGVFMSIDNGTTYYPIVLMSTGRLTTHYPINNYITVVFEPSGSAASVFPVNGGDARTTVTGGVWRVINFYNTNDNDTSQLRSYYSHAKAGVNGIKQYSLFARTLNGANTVYSSFTTNNGTGTKTFDTTHYFDIRKIYYYNGSGNVAANSTIGDNTMSQQINLVDGRYTFNSITTSSGFTANSPIYMVFDKANPSYNCYKIKSPYWTHTPNDANAIYVLVGFAYDAYRISLMIENLAFEYKDSKLVPYGTGGGGGDADLYSNCHVIVDTTMLTSGATLRVRSTTDSTKVWNATVTTVGTPVTFDVPCYDRYYACIVSNNEEMARAFFNADYGQTVYIGNLGNKYSLEGIQTILDAHKEVDMINIGDEVSISIDGTDTTFLVAAINLYNDHEIIFSAKYAYDSWGWSNSSSAQESYPSTYYQIMQHVENIYNAIDGSDKNLIKTTNKICRKPYDNNIWTPFTAHFWLPNSHELDGTDDISSKGLKQFPLYLTAQNRIRSLVNGSANWWYTCDGCRVSAAIQSVAASGGLDHLSPNSPRLIVPHFRMTANA